MGLSEMKNKRFKLKSLNNWDWINAVLNAT
jgi:hypothetical protein